MRRVDRLRAICVACARRLTRAVAVYDNGPRREREGALVPPRALTGEACPDGGGPMHELRNGERLRRERGKMSSVRGEAVARRVDPWPFRHGRAGVGGSFRHRDLL